MKKPWLVFFVALLLAACETAPISPTPTPVVRYATQITCAEVESAVNIPVACVAMSDDALLLQTSDREAAVLWIENILVTFLSTIYWSVNDDHQMTIAALEDIAVVSVDGVTRIVQPGGQVKIPLVTGTLRAATSPTLPEPYTVNALWDAPFDALPREITLPDPIVVENQAAPITRPEATSQQAACTPRADWTGTYTIQRGDTLTRIATVHAVAVDDLQSANCITNPNRISPGDVLRVPVSVQAGAGTITSFTAAQSIVIAGECTTLTWQAEDARVVYFEDEAVPRSDTRQVCPSQTLTYTLRVILENGEQVEYPLVISVQTP